MALNPRKSAAGGQPRHPRLETQIHRRKKAKALSPLQSEWEGTDQGNPSHLRMDAGLMAPKNLSPREKQRR